MTRFKANAIVAALTLALPTSFAAFLTLNRLAMASPDPFNNLHGRLSILGFILFVLVFALSTVFTIALEERISTWVSTVSWLMIGLGGLFLSYFLFGLLRVLNLI